MGEQGKFNEVFVLVAVTDDERIRVVHIRKDSMKFRLRTGFKTDVELFTVANDFFKNRALLVHLDREYVVERSLVSIFLNRLVEALIDFFNAHIENIREADEQRCRHVSKIEFLHQLVKINCRTLVTKRTDSRMSFFVNVEVIDAPPADVIKIAGIVDTPIFHFV